MNKRKTYEAPFTRVAKVELRTNLLAASIMEPENNKAVSTKGHEVGETYDFGANATVTGDNEFSISWGTTE